MKYKLIICLLICAVSSFSSEIVTFYYEDNEFTIKSLHNNKGDDIQILLMQSHTINKNSVSVKVSKKPYLKDIKDYFEELKPQFNFMKLNIIKSEIRNNELTLLFEGLKDNQKSGNRI